MFLTLSRNLVFNHYSYILTTATTYLYELSVYLLSTGNFYYTQCAHHKKCRDLKPWKSSEFNKQDIKLQYRVLSMHFKRQLSLKGGWLET